MFHVDVGEPAGAYEAPATIFHVDPTTAQELQPGAEGTEIPEETVFNLLVASSYDRSAKIVKNWKVIFENH